MSDTNYNHEDVCFICHRPESEAGKMVHLPGNLCICTDCMQKSFDSMENMGFPMFGPGSNPFMPNGSNPFSGTETNQTNGTEQSSGTNQSDANGTSQSAGSNNASEAEKTQQSQQQSDAEENGEQSGAEGKTLHGDVVNPDGSAVVVTPDGNGSKGKDKPDGSDGDDGQKGPENPNQFGGFEFTFPFDLGNIFSGGMPGAPKVKKRKKKNRQSAQGAHAVDANPDDFPTLDVTKIPAPHKIKALLDQYVIGQEKAKKYMSVAVYNHYKRIASEQENEKNLGTEADLDGVEIQKSNMLLIGPTGSGKTYMVQTLAKLLDVPLAITDATSLTEAGYIGDDIESVVSKLLAAADNDVDRAEQGIIFIDEIDKLAKKRNATQRDVSGESVQQGMLKLLEGAEIEVPVGASSKNAMVPLTTVDTSNILFIVGGAFPGLEDIIKERLTKHSLMGFNSDLKDEFDDDKHILDKVQPEDLRAFGMIPEFIGRLPIVTTFEALDEDMLVRILKEPKNAIIKQYQKLLALDDVKLTFDDGALRAIAKKAAREDLGARALRGIIEEYMMDIMYEIPKDPEIGEVEITEEYIEHKGGPRVTMRTTERIADHSGETATLQETSADEGATGQGE